jgi:histidinol-phosphate aminotransferase
MMAIKQPYNVNVAADVASRAALRHRASVMETVQMLVAERARLVEALRPFPWLKPNPSQANFVLFNVEGRSAGELAAALRRRGVLVRHYNRPDLRDCIRISAGRPHDTDRLVQVLAEVAHA